MNDAHLHLLVNHVPIIGGALASAILAWGIFRKEKAIVGMALVIFILLGVASFVAHQTGEGAEEVLEHGVAQYDHAMIHEHEEAAFPAHLAMMLTAFGAIITLAVRKLRDGRLMPIVVLGLSLVAFGLMARAGNLGGKIVHSEISDGPSAGGGAVEEDGDD